MVCQKNWLKNLQHQLNIKFYFDCELLFSNRKHQQSPNNSPILNTGKCEKPTASIRINAIVDKPFFLFLQVPHEDQAFLVHPKWNRTSCKGPWVAKGCQNF